MKHCLQRLIYPLNQNKNEGVNEDIKSKHKPWSKRRYKIKIKIYANKTGCPNIIHGWDFLSSNLMNNFITSKQSDHYDRLFFSK